MKDTLREAPKCPSCGSATEFYDWWNGGQKAITPWRIAHGLRVKCLPSVKRAVL
jgi:hypothetical protein